jgi:hypothetical protein
LLKKQHLLLKKQIHECGATFIIRDVHAVIGNNGMAA